jgi:hypothetical protein
VDTSASLSTAADADALFREVESLDGYSDWLEIVARVENTEPMADDPGPAWLVDLRGQLGPLRRSKRLRMVRSVHSPPHRVEFIRLEVDGRAHSPWTLTAEVASESGGSRLDMTLHYGGGLWVPLLDRILRDEIERSKSRLVQRLARAG